MPDPNAIATEQSASGKMRESPRSTKTAKKSGEFHEEAVRKNLQKKFPIFLSPFFYCGLRDLVVLSLPLTPADSSA
jgi:hypothetical protein